MLKIIEHGRATLAPFQIFSNHFSDAFARLATLGFVYRVELTAKEMTEFVGDRLFQGVVDQMCSKNDTVLPQFSYGDPPFPQGADHYENRLKHHHLPLTLVNLGPLVHSSRRNISPGGQTWWHYSFKRISQDASVLPNPNDPAFGVLLACTSKSLSRMLSHIQRLNPFQFLEAVFYTRPFQRLATFSTPALALKLYGLCTLPTQIIGETIHLLPLVMMTAVLTSSILLGWVFHQANLHQSRHPPSTPTAPPPLNNRLITMPHSCHLPPQI